MEGAREAIDSMGLTVLFIDKVKLKKGKRMTKSYICVVTESRLFFFKKGAKQAYSSYSLALVSNFVADSTKITLTINDTLFVLTCACISDFGKAVQDALCHILTTSELATFTDKRKMKSVRSNYGAFCRFREMVDAGKCSLSPEVEMEYEDVLIFRKPQITLPRELTVDALKVILNTVEIADGIKALAIDSDVWQQDKGQFLSLAKDRRGVQYLDLKCGVTDGFGVFCDYLTNNAQSVMSGLALRGSKLQRSDLEKIRQVTWARKLLSLDFEKSIDSEDFSFMYVNVFPSLVGSSLVSVSMDGMNIDLNCLLESLSYIRFLSVANCGLCIGEALKSVCKYRNILRINLNHNVCRESASFDFEIPDTLKDVSLDFVEFESGTLSKAVVFLFENMPRRSFLSLRHANSKAISWKNMFKALGKAQPTKLRGVSWDGNTLHQSLLQYLSRSVISVLSFSGCFSPKQRTIVEKVCSLVSSSATLSEFICRGTGKRGLGHLTSLVLQAVAKSKSLRYVDLGMNGGTLDSLSVLQDTEAACKDPVTVSIDGLTVQTPSDLLDFLEDQSQNVNNWHVLFPEVTMKEQLNNGEITTSEYNAILDLFREATPNDYLKPFQVQRLMNDVECPFYLSSRASELLSLYPDQASYMKGVRLLPNVGTKKKIGSLYVPSGFAGRDLAMTMRNNEQVEEAKVDFGKTGPLMFQLATKSKKPKGRSPQKDNMRTSIREKTLISVASDAKKKDKEPTSSQWKKMSNEEDPENNQRALVVCQTILPQSERRQIAERVLELDDGTDKEQTLNKSRQGSAQTHSKRVVIVQGRQRRSDTDTGKTGTMKRIVKRRFKTKTKKGAASQKSKLDRTPEIFSSKMSRDSQDVVYDKTFSRTAMQQQVKDLIANPIGLHGTLKAGQSPKRIKRSVMGKPIFNMTKEVRSLRQLNTTHEFKDDDAYEPAQPRRARKLTDVR